MTWIEKLKAKLKEKGLPEILALAFKEGSDKDLDGIMDGLTDIKADSPEFETILNTVIEKHNSSLTDSTVNKAVISHERKLKSKYDFVEKKSKTETTIEPQDGNELLIKKLDELTKTVAGMQEQNTRVTLVNSFLAKAKDEKKLPDFWANKYTHLINKPEDVELVLGTAEKEYTDTKQLIINDQFGGEKGPQQGNNPPTDTVITSYAEGKNKNEGGGKIKGKEL